MRKVLGVDGAVTEQTADVGYEQLGDFQSERPDGWAGCEGRWHGERRRDRECCLLVRGWGSATASTGCWLSPTCCPVDLGRSARHHRPSRGRPQTRQAWLGWGLILLALFDQLFWYAAAYRPEKVLVAVARNGRRQRPSRGGALDAVTEALSPIFILLDAFPACKRTKDDTVGDEC